MFQNGVFQNYIMEWLTAVIILSGYDLSLSLAWHDNTRKEIRKVSLIGFIKSITHVFFYHIPNDIGFGFLPLTMVTVYRLALNITAQIWVYPANRLTQIRLIDFSPR